MANRVFWRRFFLGATLATAALIFFFSAQQGPDSSQMSEGLTLFVARLIRPGFMELPDAEKLAFLDRLGYIVRKCAHFSEFALLGFNLTAWLRLRRPDSPRIRALPRAWGLATLYAATDELHQMFVAERGPALLDVCIDSAGALAGVLVMLLILWFIENRQQPN